MEALLNGPQHRLTWLLDFLVLGTKEDSVCVRRWRGDYATLRAKLRVVRWRFEYGLRLLEATDRAQTAFR